MGCSCRTFASVTTGSTAVSGDWVIVGVGADSMTGSWTRRSRSWSSCSRNLIVRSQWSTSSFCSSIFFWIIFKISLFIRDRCEAEFDYRRVLLFTGNNLRISTRQWLHCLVFTDQIDGEKKIIGIRHRYCCTDIGLWCREIGIGKKRDLVVWSDLAHLQDTFRSIGASSCHRRGGV